LKLLIAYGDENKLFHLKEFAVALSKLGIKYKFVKDTDYVVGFPSKKIKNWLKSHKKFKNLIQEFSPDAVFIDRLSQFGVETIKSKIPLFVLLRGNYWSEVESAKKTLHKGRMIRSVIWFRNKTAEKCFKGATMVFPSCSWLENIVKEKFPTKATSVFAEGVNASHWYQTKGMNLKHPCVGLLQHAFVWEKTKEMLILKKVLEKMPDVHFYWAGFGTYQERILQELKAFDNFHWIGAFSWEKYPANVREFLSSIDVYALPSGLDTIPLTLKEAQLLEKAVVATNVGGIPEGLQENQTGFLVEEGDHKGWIDKLSILINDKDKAKKMGYAGRKFVEKNFNWNDTAKNFVNLTKPYIKNRN